MLDTTVLIIGLVTLTAAYHNIRIFSSWIDGFLLHLQACRTRPYHWLGHAHRSLPLHQDLLLLDGCFSFALISMPGTTVLISGLVTLTAAYHHIRIFISWMDGSLLHLQVCRTRPYHWLGHAQRSLPLHQDLQPLVGWLSFALASMSYTTVSLACHAHRSLLLYQDLQLLDGWLSFGPVSMSDSTVLMIDLVTLIAAYHYIRIFGSWMKGCLLHLHACRKRPYHWLGHVHRSLPVHQDLQLLDGWFSFSLASMSDMTVLVVGWVTHRSLTIHQDLQR